MPRTVHKDTPSALELSARLQREFLAGELCLPLLPDTALRVVESCRSQDGDARKVAAVVQGDPSLSSHVLRTANSAAFAPNEPIVSLQQAISRMGFGALTGIAISIVLRGDLFVAGGREAQLKHLWRHSATTAAWAREIARLRRHNVEAAFLSGLLHDVGRAVILSAVSGLEELADCQVDPGLEQVWSGELHGEMGARLVAAWNLPTWAQAAARHHHRPRAATSHADEVLTVHVADRLAHWSVDDDEPALAALRCDPVLAQLDIYADELDPLLEARERVANVAEAYL